MVTRSVRFFSILIFLGSLLLGVPAVFAERPALKEGISPQTAADYIHSIIEADRTIYSEVIVERMAFTISLKATENWERDNTLLLPAQFLLMSSKFSNQKESGMTYRLMSLWPINKKNGPKTEFEKKGLEAILANPDETYSTIKIVNGKKIFQAIYPDKAVTKSCVHCHNQHPKSPKTDFKFGDVMGGIIIKFPLEGKNVTKQNGEYIISAKLVSDYIHSVLAADRAVYSKFIVNRLQENNIVFASEFWWEDNALLLPAQFLLNASDLIVNKRIGLDFKLISPWPINTYNRAKSEFEQLGLEHVVKKPDQAYTNTLDLNGKKIFQAVYPDIAVSPACVSCHNSHPNSPKRDFKLNDVMGGILMTFPLKTSSQ